METTSFLPSGYCHEGKSSLSSDLHRFQPIGLRFIFTSNNDGHFIGIEECSSVHKELNGSHIKRQTTVVAYFNRQKGEETFTRLLYGSLQACQIHLLIKHIPWKFIYQGSHKLWKSWKTWKITKISSMHGKIMEFEKT